GGGGDGGGAFPGGGGGGFLGGARPQVRIKMHAISADEQTNTIFVSGPPDKISLAKQIVTEMDKPRQGMENKQFIGGPMVLKTYTVPAGNADALATQLKEIYKSSTMIRIAAVGSAQIMVYANGEDQIDIAVLISGAKADADPV